jgi:5-methyltetrahydrofolate--homocysteine methyltransferase
MKTNSNLRYLDAINDHVVLFDGAMGTSIEAYKLTADDFGGEQYNGCNDYLVITCPDVIQSIHESFLAVGSEAVETDTFRSNRLTLADYNLHERTLEINCVAAKIARKACDIWEQKTGIPRFVAGSIGPTGKLPSGDDPDLSDITFDELADIFYEQAQGLVEGGADLLLIETSQDILEVKAAIHGITRYFTDSGRRVPLQAQITLDTSGRMLFGTDIASALVTLEPLPIDIIGINCSTGPEHMREPLQYLADHSRFPISVLPNAGLPINVDGEAVYPMEPEPFSEMVSEFTRWGINVVGGCCGTTPEHLDLLYQKVHGHSHQEIVDNDTSQHAPIKRDIDFAAQTSSGMIATPITQDPAPTLIGERVNTQGSRKVKRLLMEDDYDSVVQIAVNQVEAGAHMLDVCVAMTERDDEKEQMETLVKKLSMAVSAPLIIDTTEPDVAEAAFAVYPGRGILNGNNLENGREKADKAFSIAKKHGTAVMSMTIDEDGMAHTRDKKLEIAQRLTEIAVNDYGLKADDLIFDTLTFPLTTGQAELRNDAIETIESIRLIKEHIPGAKLSLGVSNVSFGVKPASRRILNSVFLFECVKAGLDMAIVNPAGITPYSEIPEDQRKLANDLIFNTDEDALPRFIQYFEEHDVKSTGQEIEDPTKGMNAEQALHWQIVHRKKEGVEALIDDCLTRQDAVGVLNNVLLPAMKEVGDKFGAGELILPFVLQSAETMKKSVSYLEQFMERTEGTSKGVMVLATVYGDVHDIGKNLVKTILSNNGYTVHDLGKQVPANTIIEKAVEHNADVIGLSALLVSTSKQMPLIVNELARRGLEIPVLIGGAAINRRFGQRIMFLEENNQPYAPGVFYCKDAFEGLDAIDKLTGDESTSFTQQALDAALIEINRPKPALRRNGEKARKTIQSAPNLPKPPFWGAKVVTDIPVEIVKQHVHKAELYRLSWGAKNKHGAEWEQLQTEFDQRFERMTKEAIANNSLNPQAVYGYFPANADGDDLIIWDADAYEKDGSLIEAERLNFPRQDNGDFLCISDYYEPINGRGVDVVQFQVATVGKAADEHFAALESSDNYSEAYFFHGLAVQMAEATANYMTRLAQKQLNIIEKRGKRYSWGYPACPELEDHLKLWQLMPQIEQSLGLKLTSAYQIVPEQSTAAIFTHHPDAKYYAVRK